MTLSLLVTFVTITHNITLYFLSKFKKNQDKIKEKIENK